MTGNFDRSSMGFDDCFCNGQAHASSRNPVSLVFASIEPIEDLMDVGFLDTRPFVCDAKNDETALFFRLNCDWFSGRRVEIGIPDDVSQDLSGPG
jgi:hypothetical protein